MASDKLMHIISDEEYRAYLDLTARVRDLVYTAEDYGGTHSTVLRSDVKAVDEAMTRAINAHNKRLNTLRRADGS